MVRSASRTKQRGERIGAPQAEREADLALAACSASETDAVARCRR